MSSLEKTSQEFGNKENTYVGGEEEQENEQKLMSEYYGLYGKANAETANGSEGKPLTPLNENDISKEIDNEMVEDNEGDHLE
jgi:hypothetical protein